MTSTPSSGPTPPADRGGRDPERPIPLRIDAQNLSVVSSGAVLLPATSVQAASGEVVALRGENGAGKTTLLRVLAGRGRPTTGTVRIGGAPVNERDPAFRRRVAAMIGLPPMASDLTVFDHIALVASTWEQDPASVAPASHRVLEEFGLVRLGSRFPHELSSGQTQTLGLALVFVRPFTVLLLDEPEQRLDASRIELLRRALLARRDAGATIVVATHSDALADRVATRTLRLEAAS